MADTDSTIDETIRVFVRQRPLTTYERESGGSEDIGERGNLLLKKEGSCVYSPVSNVGTSDKFVSEYKYNFSECYGSNSTQEDVYEGTARSIVKSALKGYSGTIFAYGPTNSGKTYTMRGGGLGVGGQQGNFSKGVMERAVEDLLEGLQSTGGELWASYLQIYCERLTDLLINEQTSEEYTPPSTAVGGGGLAAISALKGARDPPTIPASSGTMDLQIREKDGKVYVEGAQRRRVGSVKSFGEVLFEGDENRATAETNLNEASSRSHSILMLNVMVPEESRGTNSANGPRSFKESTILLVDLAGCERAEASAGRHHKRSEEARSINLSLTSLGNCMSSLAEKRKHIPYRDSKLTRLLQGSLGVGARTSVIVTLPPLSAENFHQSALPVLRFASRAMKVTVSAKVNRFVDYKALYDKAMKDLEEREADEKERQQGEQSSLLLQYQDDLAKAEAEVSLLRRQLLAYKGNTVPPSAPEFSRPSDVFLTSDENTSNDAKPSVGSSSGESYWRAQIETLTQTHLRESETLREEKDRKARVLSRRLEESQDDVERLRRDLKKERETHLDTAQKMRQYQQNSQEMESDHEERLAELLTESTEMREQLESQAEALDLYREQTKRMERILQEELRKGEGDEGGEGGSVPREKFDELQTMFAETVERLTSRVMQLEEGRTGAGAGAGAGAAAAAPQRSTQRGTGARFQPSAPAASRKGPFDKGIARGTRAGGGGGFGVQGLGRR